MEKRLEDEVTLITMATGDCVVPVPSLFVTTFLSGVFCQV